jgi:hypothetical protein
MENQTWYKPSQIVKEGLILAPNGKPNYRYVIRMIKSGALKAKVWTQQGKNTGTSVKDYYMVHIDDIKKFNEAN